MQLCAMDRPAKRLYVGSHRSAGAVVVTTKALQAAFTISCTPVLVGA